MSIRASEMTGVLQSLINFWRFSVSLPMGPPSITSGQGVEGYGLSDGHDQVPRKCEWDQLLADRALCFRRAATAFIKLYPPVLIEASLPTAKKTLTGQISQYMKRSWIVTHRLLKEIIQVSSQRAISTLLAMTRICPILQFPAPTDAMSINLLR